jgi:putative protein kinase ArgK-like GTPase of G3E family
MIDLSYPARLTRGCNPTELMVNGGVTEKAEGKILLTNVEPWEPPVIRTSAPLGEGIDEAVRAIYDHRDYLVRSGEWQRRDNERLQNGLISLLQDVLVSRWRAGISDEVYQEVLVRLSERELSPYEAVEELLGEK